MRGLEHASQTLNSIDMHIASNMLMRAGLTNSHSSRYGCGFIRIGRIRADRIGRIRADADRIGRIRAEW